MDWFYICKVIVVELKVLVAIYLLVFIYRSTNKYSSLKITSMLGSLFTNKPIEGVHNAALEALRTRYLRELKLILLVYFSLSIVLFILFLLSN